LPAASPHLYRTGRRDSSRISARSRTRSGQENRTGTRFAKDAETSAEGNAGSELKIKMQSPVVSKVESGKNADDASHWKS
jgi:hypothetical protein